MTSQLYSLLMLLSILWYATSEDGIGCSKYFEHERSGDQYIGKITLPNVSSGTIKLDVKVSVPVVLQSSEKSRIKLYTDPGASQDTIRNGSPPPFRLEFPTSKVLPKITSISVNDSAICADEEYSAPSTTVDLQHTLKSETIESVCGHEGVDSDAIINGDRKVRRGKYPWMVSIYQLIENEGLKFICGGSLISSRTIISAAHCFKLLDLVPSKIIVALGKNDLENFAENGVALHNVNKLIVHPEFNRIRMTDADVALLHLDSPVSFSEYISPICLWSEPADENIIADVKATVAGWFISDLGSPVSSLPHELGQTIVKNADCLRQNEIYRSFATNRTICAGTLDDSDPCKAFSGSGLMIKRDGIWMLRGITSVGRRDYGHCEPNDYVIYCDVAKHITWVRENMRE